jgi:hypothetical protein
MLNKSAIIFKPSKNMKNWLLTIFTIYQFYQALVAAFNEGHCFITHAFFLQSVLKIPILTEHKNW